MIHVLAVIRVIHFDALEKFEREAVKIMRDYGGAIISAFETIRNADGSGEEVHVLAFESEEKFNQYRNDGRHLLLKDFRKQAIFTTDIKLSSVFKHYR